MPASSSGASEKKSATADKSADQSKDTTTPTTGVTTGPGGGGRESGTDTNLSPEALKGVEASPDQTAEERAAILAKAQPGLTTVTGQMRADHTEDRPIPTGEERGSQREIADRGKIVADYSGESTQKPVGAQAKPANISVTGTVPVNRVPSPIGPIPRGAVGAMGLRPGVLDDPRSKASFRRQKDGEPLDPALVNRMSSAELRAVAADRGYNIPHGGNVVTRRRFLAAEKEAFGSESKDKS